MYIVDCKKLVGYKDEFYGYYWVFMWYFGDIEYYVIFFEIFYFFIEGYSVFQGKKGVYIVCRVWLLLFQFFDFFWGDVVICSYYQIIVGVFFIFICYFMFVWIDIYYFIQYKIYIGWDEIVFGFYIIFGCINVKRDKQLIWLIVMYFIIIDDCDLLIIMCEFFM